MALRPMSSTIVQLRKTVFTVETVFSEAGRAVSKPVRRAVAMTVIDNPFAGRYVEDLSPLFDAGERIGEQCVPTLLRLLEAPAVAYGKAAAVGADGDLEHASAIIHPKLGKPLRAAVGGGLAVVPSNVKVAGIGASIDVPLAHKDDPWSFPEMDTITVSVGDAPRPREIVVVIALSSGGRPNSRSGKTRAV